MSHKILRLVVAFAIGLALSLYAYHRVTDPRPAMQRAEEEAVVRNARSILEGYLEAGGDLRIVDPLAPDRKVGKVYIYPTDAGWEVSGHYRRNDRDRWHPFLMQLDADAALSSLSVRDNDRALAAKADTDPKLQTTPQELVR